MDIRILFPTVYTSALTDEGGGDAQAVSPEVGAAVGHGAVAEQVAVADGVQVGHGALVVSARAAAAPPLAVGAVRVPDAAHVQRAGQVPPGPSAGEDAVGATLSRHQEQRCHRQQDELHVDSVDGSAEEEISFVMKLVL